MFWTDLLSVVLVILTVCLLAINITSMTNTYCCEYSIKTPDDGQ